MRLFRIKARRSAEAAKVGVTAEEEKEGRQGLLRVDRHRHGNEGKGDASSHESSIELPNLQNLYLHSAPPPTTWLMSKQQEQATSCTTQIVTLKAFIHCQGCARRVKKTLSKLQGVNTYHVDMDLQKVTVIGSLCAEEVLASVNKVIKGTQMWAPGSTQQVNTSSNNAMPTA